jgi:hypothetical protein
MFKSADVVYFKQAMNSSRRKSSGCTFKGYGFGMFLGQVPPFGKDPSAKQFLQMIGACGFLSFDDVADFLGDEMASKCVQAYEKKYYGGEEPPGQILGTDGKPVGPPGFTPVRAIGKEPPTALPPGADAVPVLTLADVQKRLKEMTPDQIRAAISNAKTNLKGPISPEQEAEITAKTCEALGIDPNQLKAKLGFATEAEEQSEPPPIFPKKI